MKAFSQLLILSALALTACQKSSSSPTAAPDSPNAKSQAQGGVDGSGGNTINGKPLEAYIIDPKKTKAYQALINGPLKRMFGAKQTAFTNCDQAGGLQDILEYVLSGKTWYLVPGPLNELTAKQIGSAVGSEQAALQNFTAVWIDSNLLNDSKMTLIDQEKLLMHELLMGVTLYRLDSEFHLCQIMHQGDCTIKSKVPTRKPTDLTTEEYDKLRTANEKLFDVKEGPQPPHDKDMPAYCSMETPEGGWVSTTKDLDPIDEILGHDGLFPLAINEASQETVDITNAKHTNKELFDLLVDATVTRSLPTNLYSMELLGKVYDSNDQPIKEVKPIGTCSFEPFKLTDSGVTGAVIVKGQRYPFTVTSTQIALDYGLPGEAAGQSLFSPSQTVLEQVPEKRTAGDRELETTLFVSLKDHKFIHISVSEMVTLSNGNGQMVNGGIDVICSVSPKMNTYY